MTYLYAQLSAQPLRPSEQQTRASSTQDELMRLLNERITPPVPLTFDQVHVRALRLVSDQVNDHGGRFPRDEHERLCELVIDSPVLIGHDRSRLPVARNFAARCMNEGERSWVEVWFYWMRGSGSHHDGLAHDIDAGVVKEGSIGFEFRLPRCSICASDMRTCEHIPNVPYEIDGDTRTAHYEYCGLERVLETSLVYRGATPNTRTVKYPLFDKLGCRGAIHRGRPAPTDPPPLLRATCTSRRESPAVSKAESRSYYCPARTVPWPRYLPYRAGHGPLTSRRRLTR